MKPISRRQFVVDGGTALAFAAMPLPVITRSRADVPIDENTPFQHLSESGANLLFYFVNTARRGDHLVRGRTGEHSYMIVQLPPQSVHEQYFDSTEHATPTSQLGARLSGPSFLVFRLWPGRDLAAPLPREVRLPYEISAFLDWTDHTRFALQTADGVRSIEWKPLATPADVRTVTLTPGAVGSAPFDLKYYQLLARQVSRAADPARITILELPAGILMALVDPTRVDGVPSNVLWRVTQNLPSTGRATIREQQYELRTADATVVRTVTERWSSQIEVVPHQGAQLDGVSVNELPPALRAIGLVRILAPEPPQGSRPSDCTAPINPQAGNGAGFLPALIDAAEIVFLTQLGGAMYRNPRFDIRTDGPFRLTGLGASLKFHYKNYDLHGAPGAISLVEYEHQFAAGRDNYIKISRVGCCPFSTLRTIHTVIAQRTVQNGVSFMEYSERWDPLETRRDFTANAGAVQYVDGYLSAMDVLCTTPTCPPARQPKSLQHPFSRIEVDVGQSARIEPVFKNPTPYGNPEDGRGDSQYLDPRAFWVYREGHPGDRTEANLLRVPHTLYDRNGKSLGTKEVPMLFLRRDFFCDAALVTRWLQDRTGAVQSLRMREWDDGRLRVALKGNVVGLTPDDPAPETPNKLNQLATDWVDYYFDVAGYVSGSGRNPFDDAAFPTYPQVRQARVYVDHVQQYARAKRPSVVAYEEAYLKSGLDPAENAAKVVLAHTEDFKNGDVKFLGGNPVSTREPDLQTAWADIQRSFKEAGEALGALVNPDPALERIALIRSALSLPAAHPEIALTEAEIQRQVRERALDPRTIFAKADAELFAGIKLSDILGVLGLEDAPQYLLNKLPPPPTGPEIARAIASDPTVLAAYDAAKNIGATVDETKRLFDIGEAALEKQQQAVRDLKAKLDETLPTRAKIEAAGRAQREAATLALFDPNAPGPDAQLAALATLELVRALEETGANTMATVVRVFLEQTIPAAANDLLVRYKRIGTDSAQYHDLETDVAKLRASLPGLVTWYESVRTLIERRTFDDAAYAALVPNVVLTGGENFDAVIEILFRLYDLYKPVVAAEVVSTWREPLAKLDAARRLNVAYLQRRLVQLTKAGEDACRTLPPDIWNKIKLLQSAWDCGTTLRTDLWTAWGRSKTAAAQLVTDRLWRQQCLETALAEPLRMVAPKGLEQQLATAQADVDAQLARVAELKARYEQELVRQGEGFATLFAQKFEAAVAGLPNPDEIRRATAAYQRAVGLLNSVLTQTLTTDWSTSNFRAADFGFLRFEPRFAPATRLTMRAGVTMTMDPFSTPPLAVSTRAYAETSLVAFRVSFLNIIVIDFDHVTFTAGTGRGTDADVKISGVGFSGSLSFIQALQDLLSGLVQGLRVDVGSKGVTVGYQSPTLDLSAPGFTFSNFAVALSVALSFDRTPVQVIFSLAEPERKATIAAGIYGGCFFCTLVMDTKRGIVASDMAMEMGAYLGIQFGPFGGYVKFMIGLRYIRDSEGVTLIGYFIAEGSLSVWVITVSARLYMGVVSHNSVAEGFCIASYTVKVAFFKKTFTAGYSKRVAGATQNTGSGSRMKLVSGEIDHRGLTLDSIGRMGGPLGPSSAGMLRPVIRQMREAVGADFEALTADQFLAFQGRHFATLDD